MNPLLSQLIDSIYFSSNKQRRSFKDYLESNDLIPGLNDLVNELGDIPFKSQNSSGYYQVNDKLVPIRDQINQYMKEWDPEEFSGDTYDDGEGIRRRRLTRHRRAVNQINGGDIRPFISQWY